MPSSLSLVGRRRRLVAATVTVAALLVAGGCSKGTSTAVTSPSSTTTTPTPTPTPSPTPTPLTGGPVLAVKIDHTPSSYPRVGLSKADVVYVEPVEGGLTRLLAVFSTTMPSKVGPVRSARESDVDLLANYGKVAFAFSGASSYTLRTVNRGKQVNLSNDVSGKGYARDYTRHAPYNLIGTTKTLLARAGGSVAPKDPGFRYGDAPPGGTPATKLSTSWQAARMVFTYSGAAKSYWMSSDGRTEKDALYNTNVLAGTVVVQYVTMTQSGNRDVNGAPTPLEKIIGKGKVTVLRGGTMWTGTWSRPNALAPTTFAVAGETLTMAPGPVWVLIVPTSQAVKIS